MGEGEDYDEVSVIVQGLLGAARSDGVCVLLSL